MSRQTVSAVIPTRNVGGGAGTGGAGGVIRGALDSTRFCDEVIIVDMHSTDDTRRICESYPNVRFFTRDDYIYGNFNFGMDAARSDWIIRLDSDERLSSRLADEIQQVLAGPTQFDAYTAPFISYFLGHPIRHGSAWEKPARLTLFRKGLLRYRVLSEHEDLVAVEGRPIRIGALQNPYIHFSTPSISRFIQKMDYYSERDFERSANGQPGILPPWRLLLSLPRFFFHYYIARRGYRDGYAGFAICALNTVYRLVHEIKAWEHRENLKILHERMRVAYDDALRKAGA